jgi:hypothetical protein
MKLKVEERERDGAPLAGIVTYHEDGEWRHIDIWAQGNTVEILEAIVDLVQQKIGKLKAEWN